ncbi:hypothetical protein DVK44_23180 [Streptomyces paludis]|uniref:Peptidoglycan binding domain-containing protein n=2 Tax=Streptomyces paludis TaxID=2282738 RepID=A0A345I1L7_9ACTN|nr:hypothetical protein DVK44_23180 [Streptomyces paludis]
MRTPVGDSDSANGRGIPAAAERTVSMPRPEVPKESAEPRETEPAPEQRTEEKTTPTSDWFAPRKPSQGTTNGAGVSTAGADGTGRGTGSGSGTGAGSSSASGSGSGTAAGTAAGMSAGAMAVSGGAPSGGSAPGSAGGAKSPFEQYSPEPYAPESYTPESYTPEPYAPESYTPAAAGAAVNAFAPGGNTPPFGIPGVDGAPTGPTTGPVTGTASLGTPPASLGSPPGTAGQGAGPRLSDDTAVLTPQQQAPEPVGAGAGQVSGAAATMGIPVVPPEHQNAFPGPAPQVGVARGPGQDAGFSAPDFPGAVGSSQGAPAAAAKPAAAAPAKKKGRSKLTLLGVAVIVIAGGAYGAGLLVNHSEVPKGTTVLGVDIGGGTREEAVAKLDATLGKRAAQPLRLNVGGKTENLTPDKAGLSFDSQATVRGAAGNDYNPVSVIGSLFGVARIAEPVIPVDEEKLTAALADLAGTSGSAIEGTIRFEPDKAVAVPGKPGKALDVNHSIISTRDAYRSQVQTGQENPVELPVATKDPTIDQAELDRAMKEFAEPAMSAVVTIRAGGKQIQFGPTISLPKILSMKPVDGKLVEEYDKKAIEQLLEGVFDGITITKGDGQQYPVSSADVAAAMQKALRGKTEAERTQTIDLEPS